MLNRYFEQLTLAERKCYNEIIKNIESYQMEWSFSNLSFECITNVYRAVLKDHPEYFWLVPSCGGTIRTRLSEVTVLIKPEVSVAIGQVPRIRQRFNYLVEELIQLAKRKSAYLYEQILFLHDYLVMNTNYVSDAAHPYDAYGCLILHEAVCSGYAAAFQVLMQNLGVECGSVSGWSSSAKTIEESHRWNYVKLSDGYYYIDVTWDDPVTSSGSTTDNLTHDFFCVDLNELRLTHRFAADQFIPKNYGTKLNYYRVRGWYLDTYSFPALRTIAMKQLQTSDKFFVKFGSRIEAERAKRELIDMRKISSIPGLSQWITYNISKSGLVLSFKNKG